MLSNLVHLYAIHNSYTDFVWIYFQTTGATRHELRVAMA